MSTGVWSVVSLSDEFDDELDDELDDDEPLEELASGDASGPLEPLLIFNSCEVLLEVI